MSRSISLKSLIRLQKRQLSRGKMNKERAGLIFLILYFWGMEILFILLYKGLGGSVPPLYLTAFLLSALVTDIMMKIILIRDMSVMDSFLKTRPVSQEVWKRFLWVSQFWAVSNLIMPVAVLPALLLLFRFPLSIAVLLAMARPLCFGESGFPDFRPYVQVRAVRPFHLRSAEQEPAPFQSAEDPYVDIIRSLPASNIP